MLPGARPQTPDGPLLVFFQHTDLAIPTPGHAPRVPDAKHWSVRSTAIGWVAAVPRTPKPGRTQIAQVLVGCLALALPYGPAIASEPAPELQRPTAPAPATDPSLRLTTAPTQPADAGPRAPALPPPPAMTAQAPPTATPQHSATSPSAARDAAVLDAAWEGVDGFRVVLELKGGMTLQGRVGAVQEDTFTLIQEKTGKVLVLPKNGVSSLRAYIPPEVPTKTGAGLITGGSVLTAIGTPLFLTGAIFVGICPSCTYVHLPLLILGAGALGGGIPMIVTGRRRRALVDKALKEHNLSPLVVRTRYGWSGGLRFRF